MHTMRQLWDDDECRRALRQLLSPDVSAWRFDHLLANYARRHYLANDRHRKLLGLADARSVKPYLRGMHAGYCSVTDAGNAGSCDGLTGSGFKGSFGRVGGTNLTTAAARCLQRCLLCPRCNFISVSFVWDDCSWFDYCDLSALKTDVQGHFTMHRHSMHLTSESLAAADGARGALPSGS